MGRKDISPESIDRVPACGADMACHISKCGKNVTQTSLRWHSCRCHPKSDNPMSVIRCNGKNIKTPKFTNFVEVGDSHSCFCCQKT